MKGGGGERGEMQWEVMEGEGVVESEGGGSDGGGRE